MIETIDTTPEPELRKKSKILIQISPYQEHIDQLLGKNQTNDGKQQQAFSPQLLLERQRKNKQIMKMIYSYKRSVQDIKHLEKIKKQTTMEINLRFINCQHNKTYAFPLSASKKQQQQQQYRQQQNPFKLKQLTKSQQYVQQRSQYDVVVYDLHAQCEVTQKSVSTKLLELESSSRRVKSLQKEVFIQQTPRKQKRRPIMLNESNRKQMHSGKYIKTNLVIHNTGGHELHSQAKRRYKNQTVNKTNTTSVVKLPELKMGINSNNHNDNSIDKSKSKSKMKMKMNLGQVIGRKIMTEASPDRAGIQCNQNKEQSRRLAKYMRNIEGSVRSSKHCYDQQPKKFFIKDY